MFSGGGEGFKGEHCEMWIKLKEAIGKAVEKHIPHGKTKSRDNLP